MLDKDQILNSDDLLFEELNIPEWGGPINVRVMSGKERDAFEASIDDKDRKSMHNFRARLCVLLIGDENGKRIFHDSQVGALSLKSSKVLNDIVDFGMKLNGMTEQDIKDMVGNSEDAPSEDSGSN